jgi:hypothetical protein
MLWYRILEKKAYIIVSARKHEAACKPTGAESFRVLTEASYSTPVTCPTTA